MREIAGFSNKGISKSTHLAFGRVSFEDFEVKSTRLLRQLGPDLLKRLVCNQTNYMYTN